MAGTTLKIRDAAFTKVTFNLRLPFINGLVSEFVHGNNDAQSIRNLANAAAPATIVGVPTYEAHHAVIKSGGGFGSIGFDIGFIPPALDITIIHCVKNVANTACWATTSSGSFNGFLHNTNVMCVYNASGGLYNTQPNLPWPVHSNYFIVAATMPIAVKHKLHLWTAGVRTESEAPAAGATSRGASTPFRIGTTHTSGGTGISNMAYTAIFNRLLTVAELDAAYLSLKNFYDGKIVVS